MIQRLHTRRVTRNKIKMLISILIYTLTILAQKEDLRSYFCSDNNNKLSTPFCFPKIAKDDIEGLNFKNKSHSTIFFSNERQNFGEFWSSLNLLLYRFSG